MNGYYLKDDSDDVERWRNKRLGDKLDLNFRGALFALTLLFSCEVVFLGCVLYFHMAMPWWRFCTFALLAFGLLFQVSAAVRYGGTKFKVPAWLNRFCGVGLSGERLFRFIELKQTKGIFKLPYPWISERAPLRNYPASRLLTESCVLFTMCAMTGGALSPYFALFLLHSSLAALVIDDSFSLFKFNFGFFFLLAALMVMLTPIAEFGLNHAVKWVFVVLYTLILFISCLLTGNLVQSLMRRVDENDELEVLKPSNRIQKMLWAWHAALHLRAFECKSGNYVISLDGGSPGERIAAADVVVLIPTCLRKKWCGVLDEETIQSVNAVCRKCDINNCDAGFIVSQLNGKVFWRIVGHGHDIRKAFEDFVDEKGRKPSTILGIACVSSFSELVGKMVGAVHDQKWQAMIKEFGIVRILYAKLVGDCADCPSMLNIPVAEHSRMQTHVDRETIMKFVEQTMNF